ncbi:YdcF family protein [uncultured Clostridium sp.]|uniref:YdcF family protein n=1 Tax=uncultured Clostridium sp. TaxID=59620 RepID=UPI0025E560CB|nr:YdcF family protein [uncultured Clostridium sp.]MDU4883371.1 YdcF family protein [Clostridium celatum]MDU7076434.1 YdcF family protein [Clostridium celatum]
MLKMMFGFVAFSSVFCMLGIVLLVYGYVELKFNIDIWGHIPKVYRIIITTLFTIGLVIFIGIESIIIYNGHHHDTQKPDYLVVLGAGLRGRSISASLLYRLETALDFHDMYPDLKIVVSGGQGEGEDMTEALAMRNFLVDNGVNPNLIIMEDKSTNTYENFLYTKNVLEEETVKEDFTITIISNNFHMYRAKFLAKEVGFNTYGYPAPSHKASALVFYVREFFGVIKAYIFRQ